VLAWKRYTAAHPPLHLMVAAYLGIEPKIADPPEETPDQHAARLIAQLTGLT
jgi:hypothetical protein